jgi:hypothetical protein
MSFIVLVVMSMSMFVVMAVATYANHNDSYIVLGTLSTETTALPTLSATISRPTQCALYFILNPHIIFRVIIPIIADTATIPMKMPIPPSIPPFHDSVALMAIINIIKVSNTAINGPSDVGCPNSFLTAIAIIGSTMVFYTIMAKKKLGRYVIKLHMLAFFICTFGTTQALSYLTPSNM